MLIDIWVWQTDGVWDLIDYGNAISLRDNRCVQFSISALCCSNKEWLSLLTYCIVKLGWSFLPTDLATGATLAGNTGHVCNRTVTKEKKLGDETKRADLRNARSIIKFTVEGCSIGELGAHNRALRAKTIRHWRWSSSATRAARTRAVRSRWRRRNKF